MLQVLLYGAKPSRVFRDGFGGLKTMYVFILGELHIIAYIVKNKKEKRQIQEMHTHTCTYTCVYIHLYFGVVFSTGAYNAIQCNVMYLMELTNFIANNIRARGLLLLLILLSYDCGSGEGIVAIYFFSRHYIIIGFWVLRWSS